MIATPITLADFVTGHTFDGIPAGNLTITPDGGVPAPPETPLDKIVMIWRKGGHANAETFTLSSDDETPLIQIVNAATWEFTMPKCIVVPATAGRWYWLVSGYGVDPTVVYPLFTGQVVAKSAP